MTTVADVKIALGMTGGDGGEGTGNAGRASSNEGSVSLLIAQGGLLLQMGLCSGQLSSHGKMSLINVHLITKSWVSLVKAQTWQASSSQGATLQLEKSEGGIADPDMCRTKA